MPTSFSAATCITSTITSPGPFNIYLDSDYDLTPFSSVTLSQITPPNCPFIFENIPTGTNSLGFKDTILNYCLTIPVQSNQICSSCNLGLSNYSATSISLITAGLLTGSCQSNITDYKINWYGPNNTTTLSFSSGSGNIFDWNYPHPLTGNQSIPVVAGVYTPIIENVIIEGTSYSNTGGTGNILTDLSNCLPTINVLPLTCNVRTNPITQYPFSAYTHYLKLDITSESLQPVTSTFKIPSSTKYLAWAFKGYDQPDRLTISLSGTSYGTTIIGLEDCVIGGNNITNPTNFTPNLFPKSASTGNYFFQKITTLTGLTINNDDNILISVTPTQPNTLWDLYITCLDNWDCNDCLSDNNYKIVGSSITGVTGACGYNLISYNVSGGCTNNDIINSDLYTYYSFGNSYNVIIGQNIQGLVNPPNLTYPISSSLHNTTTECQNQWCNYQIGSCFTDSTPTSYNKTFLGDGKGVFGFTGSSDFISTYYNSWFSFTTGSCSGSTNSSNINYYRYYIITIPSQTAPENCGDFIGNRYIQLYLHHTSTISTGMTGSQYYMKLTANTITNNLSFSTCDVNCQNNVNYYVSSINNYSTGTTNNGYGTNRTFSNGIYYKTPITCLYNYITTSTVPTQSSSGLFKTSTFQGNTYPFSGYPSTIIPSLSGTVCDYNLYGVDNNFGTFHTYYHYKYYYETRLTNSADTRNFDIWASPITNFVYSGAPYTPSYSLAYRYSGGNVTYSSSTYIIG